jgi:hypothetical protein
MGGGGKGMAMPSGMASSLGAARWMMARAFSVNGSRWSHGFSTTMMNAELVVVTFVIRFRPLISITSTTAGSSRTIRST